MGNPTSSSLTLKKLLGFCVLWHVLGAGPEAGSTISCCKHEFTNGSTAYALSHSPGPDCTTFWSVNDAVIIDEAGGVDWGTVWSVTQNIIILSQNFPSVVYHLACPQSGVSQNVQCSDYCIFTEDPSQGLLPPALSPTAPKRPFQFTVISILSCFFVLMIILLVNICKYTTG